MRRNPNKQYIIQIKDYGNYSSSSLVYLVISILLAYTLKKWEQIGYYVNSDIKTNISTCDYLSTTETIYLNQMCIKLQ